MKPYHNIQNRQRGMVSHLLLFIVLIMLANAAIFTPNINALKDNRQSAEKITDDTLLNVLASSIARASSDNIRSTGRVHPIAAVFPDNSDTTSDATITTPLLEGNNPTYAYGGKLPRNLRQMAPLRPDSLRRYMRYCPYYPVEAGYSSTNGYIPAPANPPILFTLILNKYPDHMMTCSAAAAGVTSDNSKYINVTPAQALKWIRSSQTENTTLSESACPAGEEMIFKPQAVDVNDEDGDGNTAETLPARFRCERNVLGLAAAPGSNETQNCTVGTALNSRGTNNDGTINNGMSCADIEIREAKVNTETYDNVNRQIVSMYAVDEYYDAVSPVAADGTWPNPALPNDIMTRLANFECPQRYYDNHPYFPGTRSKGVIILRDGSLICAGGWTLLNSRPPNPSNGPTPCPEGKKIVWDATTATSNTFVCEGVNANDTTYGRWEESCSLANGDGPLAHQVVGYSPNTNQFYCYLSSNSQQARDRTYTYPERSSANCKTDAAVTLLNNSADCSQTYPELLHTGVHGLANYHANWAYNWDPAAKTIVSVDPGPTTYTPVGLPAGQDVVSAPADGTIVCETAQKNGPQTDCTENASEIGHPAD
ncbi:MAG: hypothetical protein EYC62_07985 [Alphaproteobacteria bacterium]|nr:MAG: hypothetical protein EYC62_07985 [Alphaproteobacteria bacterium]